MIFPVVPRASSSLLLAVRNQLDSPSISSAGYQLLMLQRHSASKFMPSRYVFPGGASEQTDFSKDWLELIGSKGLPILKPVGNVAFYDKMMDSQPVAGLPPHIGFRICAIRETFEESGVLLVRPLTKDKTLWQCKPRASLSLDKETLDFWRKRVSKNASTFIELCREIQCAPDIWSLYEWSNWVTPVIHTRVRFNTIFYFAFLDNKPEMSHDGEETTHSLWVDTIESLQLHSKKKLLIAPPQLFELSRLCRITSYDVLKETVMSVTGVEEFESVTTKTKDGNLAIFLNPDDRYEEMRSKVYRQCEDFLKTTKSKPTALFPLVQLDETSEQLRYNVEAGQNTCRVLFCGEDIMSTSDIEVICNYDTLNYNMPVPVKNLIKHLQSKL